MTNEEVMNISTTGEVKVDSFGVRPFDGEMLKRIRLHDAGVHDPSFIVQAKLSADAGYKLVPEGTTIPELQQIIHEWAIEKEWRGPKAETQRTTGDDIALIVSEAAEALEAYREVNDPKAVWYTYTVVVDGVKFKDVTVDQLRVLLDLTPEEDVFSYIDELELKAKPEGVGPELADVVIRVLDYCEDKGIDLLARILEKQEHNGTREVRHGGKHL